MRQLLLLPTEEPTDDPLLPRDKATTLPLLSHSSNRDDRTDHPQDTLPRLLLLPPLLDPMDLLLVLLELLPRSTTKLHLLRGSNLLLRRRSLNLRNQSTVSPPSLSLSLSPSEWD